MSKSIYQYIDWKCFNFEVSMVVLLGCQAKNWPALNGTKLLTNYYHS